MLVEPTLTFGGIASILAVIGSAFGINGAIRKRHRENQQDAQDREDRLRADINKHHTSFEDRLKTVEVTIRDFMPRPEITSGFQHEKNNRIQADDAQQRQIDRLMADTTQIRIELGRVVERSDGISADVAEIKALVKEQGRDTAARLDRMSESMAAIAHPAR